MHFPSITREIHSCEILSLFTFENILCLLHVLSLIYPAGNLCEIQHQSYAKKVMFSLKKRMEGILFMYWNIC